MMNAVWRTSPGHAVMIVFKIPFVLMLRMHSRSTFLKDGVVNVLTKNPVLVLN